MPLADAHLLVIVVRTAVVTFSLLEIPAYSPPSIYQTAYLLVGIQLNLFLQRRTTQLFRRPFPVRLIVTVLDLDKLQQLWSLHCVPTCDRPFHPNVSPRSVTTGNRTIALPLPPFLLSRNIQPALYLSTLTKQKHHDPLLKDIVCLPEYLFLLQVSSPFVACPYSHSTIALWMW